MYEFAPAPGTRVNKIVNLTDDLALALEALRVRIVAPIPGKAAVGIEVPNKTDRKSTRLNSSHSQISYAVFCLKKKNNKDLTNNGVQILDLPVVVLDLTNILVALDILKVVSRAQLELTMKAPVTASDLHLV